MIQIADITVPEEATIRETLARLEQGGIQIVLVIDLDGRLKGVVTDGDFRRGVLRGLPL